jgi:hypothetical protein
LNFTFVILSIFTISLMVYGTYPDYDPDAKNVSDIGILLYESTMRIVYSFALAYLIFACLTNNGGLNFSNFSTFFC